MGRQDSIAEGRSYNYLMHNEIMPQIAQELGIDVLPMAKDNYDYDFYRFAVIVAMEHGLKGAERYDTAGDVMRVILSPHKGRNKAVERAPIFDYVRRYRMQEDSGVTPQTFDAYWRMHVHRKIQTVMKGLLRYKQKGNVSLNYSGDEDEGGVGDWFEPVSREPSPYEALRAREEAPKLEKAMEAVPKKLEDYVPKRLTEERNGAAYVALWKLLQERDESGKKYTAEYMANLLNSMQVRAPGVTGVWTKGAVDRAQTTIYGLANQVMREHGVDPEFVPASRKGFRFGVSLRR